MAERPTWLPAWSQLGMTKIFNIALLIILEVAALTTSLFINRAGESNAIFGKPIEVWITPLILLTTHVRMHGHKLTQFNWILDK